MTATEPIAAVTGATGFLGAGLVDQLIDRQRVRVLVRREDAQVSRWRERGCEVVLGDLGDLAALDALVRGAETVHHCAATMIKTDAALSHQVNVAGTENLGRAAHRAGVRRIMYVSSTSVYLATQGEDGVLTEDNEPVGTSSLNHYSRTKYEGEQVIRRLGGELGLAYTIMRPTNIYGLRSGPWFRHWQARLARFPVAIGGVPIDLVYVDDVATAMIQAAGIPAAAGEVFNVGHEMVPMNRFAVAVGKVTGRKVRVMPSSVDRILSIAIDRGYRRVTGSALSPSLVAPAHYPHAKATRAFGYAPRFTLESAFDDIARRYRAEQSPRQDGPATRFDVSSSHLP